MHLLKPSLLNSGSLLFFIVLIISSKIARPDFFFIYSFRQCKWQFLQCLLLFYVNISLQVFALRFHFLSWSSLILFRCIFRTVCVITIVTNFLINTCISLELFSLKDATCKSPSCKVDAFHLFLIHVFHFNPYH